MTLKSAIIEPKLVPVGLPERAASATKPPESIGQMPAALASDAIPAPKRFAVLSWLIVITIVSVTGYFRATWLPLLAPLLPAQGPVTAKPTARVIPVATASVLQRDMDLHLNGLGTATAFKTVTVRSRVEGELLKVHFAEGQMVAEGDLLAEIDSREFEVQREQAEGQLARDEATQKQAKLTWDRYQGLLKSNVIVQQQLEDQAALLQQADGAVRTDRALLANASLQLEYCRIVAPISGRIGLRLVDQGNVVRANDSNGLAVITQLQPIAVVFTIPQDDIARVQKQMRQDQPLPVEAYDRDFKTKLAVGKLIAIDNQVDSATGTLRLKAAFENEDQLLFPNQFVNARLVIETRRDTLVVPTAAVQRGPASPFVYVVQADETVELRSVVLGPSEGNETSIESGLTAGEVVVTDGIDKLQPRAKVSLRGRDKGRNGDKGPR